MKVAAQLLLLCLVFLCVVPSVYAARSITITGNKTSLLGDEELVITASASGFTEGEIVYIKGAFFQGGSSNYFGFTKNSDAWIKNSASNTTQRAVKVGEWDGTIVVKSDFGDSGYKGEGDYSVKVGFYWGSASSVNWSSNALAVAVNEPDPTPTSSPTPTYTPTPVPSPTPTKQATPTPSIKPSVTPTLVASPIATVTGEVLSDSSASGDIEDTPIVQTSSQVLIASSSSALSLRPFIFSLLCVSAGLGLLSGVFVWQKKNASGGLKTNS
jgi:hypothetical protein